MVGDEVEIFVRQGGKTLKVVLKGDAVKEIEDIRQKLGTSSIMEAILYSVRILTIGLNETSNGEQEHKVKLPTGKELYLKVSKV